MKKLIALLLCTVLLSFAGCAPEENGLEIVTVTDTHFTGYEHYSYEGTFFDANDSNGTGKQIRYNEDLVDAFIREMLSEKPDFIIMTGDLAFNGAKVSHLALAEKLGALSEAGIKVLVLPGNHDITGYTYIFPSGEPETAESASPEEFREIYADFGYTGAVSYDPESLSYVYDTGKGARIFMLDTNITYGVTLGKINSKTFAWLEEQLAACAEAGDSPIVAGHHSLLSHNPRFDFSYKLGNGDEVADLITEYGASLYLCGHLHTQHIVQSEKLTDIVTGGFCVYPHRYGVINYKNDGWEYEAKAADIEGYAESIGSTDENLLDYSEYGYNFFYDNAYIQAVGGLSEFVSDPELLEKYAVFSAKLNVAYFGGDYSELDLSIAEDFLKDCEGSGWANYLSYALADAKDNTVCGRNCETE
ncbi:MAG: metallophosphoesterase [Oscillospiraceae bacterium]|nr:metallophosphoesterase [Oscillospiraceae bacterium]